jgi:hypothetical protein
MELGQRLVADRGVEGDAVSAHASEPLQTPSIAELARLSGADQPPRVVTAPERQHCPKEPHVSGVAHLHSVHDDGPYDVDGILYCGRCHYVCRRDGTCENPRRVPEPSPERLRKPSLCLQWGQSAEPCVDCPAPTACGFLEVQPAGAGPTAPPPRDDAHGNDTPWDCGHCHTLNFGFSETEENICPKCKRSDDPPAVTTLRARLRELHGMLCTARAARVDAELRGRLAALTEVHECYEFDATTEEQFDAWLHEQIKTIREQLGIGIGIAGESQGAR